MPTTKNLSLVLKAVPSGMPIPGKHLTVEDRPIDVTSSPQGGFVTCNVYFSLDPYMRLMLIDPSTTHYRKPFALNEPIISIGIGKIVASSNETFPLGRVVRASLPIQQYSTVTSHMISTTTSPSSKVKLLPLELPFNPACYISALGMPGLTAFSSIYEIGRPQAGETIFISAAAGAVGQIAGQICKNEGPRIVGSVGSDEKLDLIKSQLGFDAGFNYRDESTDDALKRLVPDGIDIYYDNVGGETLEAALKHMRKNGRIVVCGMVSQYNSTAEGSTSEGAYGVKNLFQLVSQGLTMRGFQVGDKDFGPKWVDEHESRVGKWIEEGKLKVVMSEMVGVEKGAEAFVGMLQGKNLGKAVLRLWPEEGEDIREDYQIVG